MERQKQEADAESLRLAAALESAVDAVVITEPEKGQIVYVNNAFERITGYPKKEALGGTLHILESDKQDPAVYALIRNEIKRSGLWQGRLISRKKDGSTYYEDCTISTVVDKLGEVVNYVSVRRDVTERLRLESVAESVNAMDNIGYVFAGVRHEIGNPINTVKMVLSVLQEKLGKASKETIADFVGRALRELGRVEHLLASLRSFSFFDVVEREPLETGTYLERFSSLVAEDLEKRNIGLDISVAPGAERLYADQRILQHILLNLITNAMDALEGRHGARISISVAPSDGGALSLQVTDNGCGMTEEQRKNLFKPFFTGKRGGTGLGLVIIKNMVTKLGGSVEITSTSGTGTMVDLLLPGGESGKEKENAAHH